MCIIIIVSDNIADRVHVFLPRYCQFSFLDIARLVIRQSRSQPDNLVMLCKFKSFSLFNSLEIDSLYGL